VRNNGPERRCPTCQPAIATQDFDTTAAIPGTSDFPRKGVAAPSAGEPFEVSCMRAPYDDDVRLNPHDRQKIAAYIDALAADLARVREAMDRRDQDWILAMADALGHDARLSIPIVPEPKAFKALFRELRQAAEQAREAAEKDAQRLDLLDSKWMDGIHVEVYGKRRGEHWADARREATVYLGNKEFKADTVRAAIDAARSQGK
jgi:hypothetical protein